MLPKKNRITSEYFPLVLRGKTQQDDILRVVFYDKEIQDRPRCAVIVHKKQAPRAVDRNRIRRTCYRVLYENRETIPPCFISLIIKKKTPTDDELKKSILQLCVNK